MDDKSLFIILLFYTAVSNLVLLSAIGLMMFDRHKLVNKVMSTDYHTYRLSEEYNKSQQQKRSRSENNINPRIIAEDLNVLSGIG